MASTEWWQRGPIDGIPAVLQPIAHILLQVRESVAEIVEPLTEQEWNARPAGVASAAFHVRHITGVIDRLFSYARGNALSAEQFAALQSEGQKLAGTDVPAVLERLFTRVDGAVAELRTIDVTTLGDFRGVGRAQLPSTVIGCLVHGAEHAMRHVGQLSVTARIVRSAGPVALGSSPGPSDLMSAAPVFRVADLARSLSYYRDLLGFETEFNYEDFYAGIVREGCRIHLKVSPPVERDQKAFEAAQHLDVCIGVRNAEDLAARFAAEGVIFSVPLRRMPYGREFYVKDPDGHILGFVQGEEAPGA